MKSSRGHALLSVVAIMGALLVAGVAAVQMTRRELRGTADNVARQKAFYVAEAGVQRALARLSQDRAAASTSTAYTYSESNQAVGEGTYAVTVVQDPVFPTDASRKRITGVGTALGQQATVVAQVHVQDAPPSTICFTDTGTCRIQPLVNVNAGGNLFTGNIFSNNDVQIASLIGANIRAGFPSPGVRSRIDAVGHFSDALMSVPPLGPLGGAIISPTGAELRTGFAYTPSALLGIVPDLHVPLLGPLAGNPIGLHFANGPLGHGTTQAIALRSFPQVDWESIRRDARTTIVNAENVPTGSWDSASGTWIVASLAAPAVDRDVIYYVEGNVHIMSLELLKGARMTIAARGWSAVEALSVVNAGLVAGSQQDVRIIAEKKNTIGLHLLSYTPTLQDMTNALGAGVATAAGIGLNIASVGTTNRIFAYSETDDVWAKTTTLSALSTTRVSMVAKHDATIAFTGSINAGILAYQ